MESRPLRLFWNKSMPVKFHQLNMISSINLIMNCITYPSFSIMLNEKPTKSLNPFRSIRQYDLILLYIFNLCLKKLSRGTNLTVKSKAWKHFIIVGKKCEISHASIADNIILFRHASLSTNTYILNTLEDFRILLGLSGNPSKCKLYFSKNSPSTLTIEISSILNISFSPKLGNYIGFRPRRSYFNQKEKISARWKTKSLFKAGRIVFTNISPNSITSYSRNYIMFLIKINKVVDKIFKDFFWGSNNLNKIKCALISW